MIQANFQFKAKTHDELGYYQYFLELKIYFISKDRESNELGQTFCCEFQACRSKSMKVFDQFILYIWQVENFIT